MLKKYTSLETLSIDSNPKMTGLQRFATYKEAHRADFNYDPQPGFLYVRSRAISSRCNDNWDEFPANEIEASYHTFIGKPVFVNHSNDDHRKSRGVIIDAALHKDSNKDGTPDTWVEVLMEVDANRYPKLAQAIIAGEVDRTSMGCDVGFSVCSACGNKATTPSEYCRHIPQLKGSKLIRRNASTGKPEEELVREICYKLSFFENSLLVEEPADPTAFLTGIDDRGLRMSAKKTGLEAFANQYAVAAPVEDPMHQGVTCAYCYGKGYDGFMPIARLGNLCGKCMGLGFNDARMKLGGLERFISKEIIFLENPEEGGHNWYHGSPNKFDKFDTTKYDREGPNSRHWNTTLGQHWTSVKDVASGFARGGFHHKGVKTDSNEGHVYTANLAIKKPKHYAKETKMDSEAVKHNWGKIDRDDPDEVHDSYCRDRNCGQTIDDHKIGDEVDQKVKAYYAHPSNAAEWLTGHPQREQAATNFREHLQNLGHDSITYGNQVEKPKGHKCAITFDTNQIQNLKREKVKKQSGLERFALGETIAPPDVDTMRDDVCPVCGSTDSYNGDKCLVCKFEKPPSMFMDPDVELASQVDLRQQQQIDAVQPPATGPLGQDQTQDDLMCPECGSQFTSSEAMNESGDPHFAPAAEGEPAISDLIDPNAENEENDPNVGGAIPDPDNTKLPGEPDQDIINTDPSQNDPNAQDNQVLDVPDTTDTDVDDDTDDSEDSNPFPPKKKKSFLQRFLSAKDDDFEDKDTDEEPEDTSENNTSNSGDIVGDDEAPGDQQVDPTNSDQPQQANGDPDGMQQDPSENPNPNDPNPNDPNAVDPNQKVDPQQLAQQQYGEDLGAEQQTGYEAGDICPNCGQGILEPNTAVDTANSANPVDLPSDQDVDPNDDPVTTQNTPKISGLNRFESTQSMSNSALPEGEYSMANNPAATQRAALRAAINQQAKMIKIHAAAGNQERLLRQAAEARIATLESQILRMAQLMGADEDSVLRDINETGYRRNASIIHQASLIRLADERDPAEPVPEPPAGAPVVTEQEAATPAARADVTQLGATPITDVSADATIAVDQPYGEAAFMPMDLNEVDVTQPVAGTQGHLPPEQTIVPVEVRVGDPDDPAPSFPITWGSDGPVTGGSVGTGGANVNRAPGSPPGVQPGTTASKDRTYASLRLAKKRIEAGIAPADAEDILIAASIDSNSDMTDARIRDEIETLSSVIEQRKQANVRTASRSTVPRSTSPSPSAFGGQGPIQSSASLSAVTMDEFWSE